MHQQTINVNSWEKSALEEAELVSSMAWFINIRWLAGLGVLAAVWFATEVLRLSLSAVPLYLIGLGILVYNALFQILLGRFQRFKPRRTSAITLLANLQIGLDYLTMTVLIHFTGGLESPAILYFFFHIVISAILLSPRVTYLYAGLATFCVTVTAGLEYLAVLPHVDVPEFIGVERYREPIYILGTLFFFLTTAFVVAYLAVTLNRRLRTRTAQIVDLDEHLRKAYGRLQILYDGAQAVNSTLELPEVLDRFVRGTAEAMDVRACSIRLLDETKTQLVVAAAYGLSDAYVKKGALVLELNPLAREVLAGGVIAIGDVKQETRLQYQAEAIAEGIRSMLSVPLMGKHGPLGLIRAYHSEPNHFTTGDNAFLSAIASYGSIAIENAITHQAFGKLDQLKSKFVLTVTHELRSPVSVVQSLLRTLTGGYAGTMTDEQRDIVVRALRRADYLQTLIDDLLDLAAGKSELLAGEECVPVRLAGALEGVIQRFIVPAREKQIALEWSCKGGDQPITVWATPEGVDRILNNLISNAIKYTPTGGRVMAAVDRTNGEALLTVADTGIGIPKDSMPHLYEEFYRAPNAKSLEKEGTGLGLSITHDLVARYGGRINVQSQVGDGTTFTVIFPIKV